MKLILRHATLSTGNALLSQVIPLVRKLENQIEKFQGISVPGWGRLLSPDVQALVRRLKEGIRRWLDPLGFSTVHMLAGVCNPRVKGSTCTGSTKTISHWTQVLVNKVREAKGQRTSSTSQFPPCQPLPMWAKGMASMLGSKHTRSHPQAGSAKALVATYLVEDMEPLDCDPLAYWANRSQVW
uniref:Uncharacterized protein n=1 Tax=Crocodylus porosus TaxID=8502 RepID=A0A7M4FYS5_CROPO